MDTTLICLTISIVLIIIKEQQDAIFFKNKGNKRNWK